VKAPENVVAVAAERLQPLGSIDATPVPETEPVLTDSVALPNSAEPLVAAVAEASAPADPRAFRDCATICPEMVRIPGGTFTMGSKLDPTERPARKVSVKSFALGRHPVTTREWRACVHDGKCAPAAEGADDMPVHNVSWSDAQDYAAWLSGVTGAEYRLPSEAEWEYAARAGTTTRYWWGDAFRADFAACRRCGPPSAGPAPVGRHPANPFGLREVTGSVSQWVADCWIPSFRAAPTDGSARVREGCRDRVLRGGSWMMEPDALRIASRAFYDGSVRYTGNGLRVARRL